MVKIASICGTNEDINALLNKVYEIYERESEKEDAKQIYIYQDFIDNSLVLKELNELGIEIIYDLNNLDSNDIVILSTSTNEDIEFLENNHIEYYQTSFNPLKNQKYLQKIIENAMEEVEGCSLVFVIGDGKDTHTITKELENIMPTYEFNELEEFSTFFLSGHYSSDILLTGGYSTPLKEIYNYKYLLEFLLFYQERLQEFKEYMPTFNQEFISLKDSEEVQKIKEYFVDLNKDGKYLRATLIALASLLAGYSDYLDLCLTYETLETSILIHDDIIDNAKYRRGKETIPRRICHEYLPYSNDGDYFNDVLKLANSLAICTGDLFFYEAENYLVKKYSTHPNFAQILKLYNDIIIKTIKGEVLDVTLPFMSKYNLKNINEDDILNIYHLKTSWYTIIGPFALGYLLGGKNLDENLENVLNKIGLAFQIKDDILGIFGDNKKIGKSVTSDIKEFKQTILYSYIINTPYKDEFLKIYGNKVVSSHELELIRGLLKESGTIDYAYDYLSELYNEVLESIDTLDLHDNGKYILKGLLIYINIRSK